MSISTRSRFGRAEGARREGDVLSPPGGSKRGADTRVSRDVASDAGTRRHATLPSGFTLIELLVVVAIIAVLMSILLPSLKCAREQARAAVCGTMLKGLGNGLMTYASEFNDWIPGVNTSGVAVRALSGAPGAADKLRRPHVPAQSWDWMTPILRYDTDLGDTRAKRFKMLINRYQCPSQKNIPSILYPPGLNASPDKSDFELTGWSALSYLMPVYFQYWGQRDKGRPLGVLEGSGFPVLSLAADTDWEVEVPSYESRIDRVGSAARKVAAADGTRYLPDSKLLDHDVNPQAQTFGSFTAGGAWWAGDTAYGVAQSSKNWDGQSVGAGSPSNGENLGLSYRHGCDRKSSEGGCQSNPGSINALHFDGSVRRYNDRASREIHLWYPAGGIVKAANEGMTKANNNDVIP